MRWPGTWTNPSALTLLKGTSIDTLLINNSDEFEPIRTVAEQSGLRVVHPDAPPDGVALIKGEWPGVRAAAGSGGEGAGPTGVPWVDSNGWAVRLAAALHPESSVWVDGPPKGDPRYTSGSYLIAVADAASRGGRWVITLDDSLAAGILKQDSAALTTWKTITGAAGFFAQHNDWSRYAPRAVVAVVSDFTGSNEFFSHEFLNLLDRAGEQYLIVPKSRLSAADLAGLRAVIYTDGEPPSGAVRRQVNAFVQAGGMLITVPGWGAPAGRQSPGDEYPHFDIRRLGKGRVATAAEEEAADPYEMANDSVVLVSHRYDLVRFWNGGATGSFYTVSPDRGHAIVHLLFYANRGPDEASVRVVGRYRTVKAWTAAGTVIPNVGMIVQKDAVEVHLPRVPQYVALEFQA